MLTPTLARPGPLGGRPAVGAPAPRRASVLARAGGDEPTPPTPASPESADEATPAAVRRRVAGRRGGGKGRGGSRGSAPAKIDDFNPVAMGRKSR